MSDHRPDDAGTAEDPSDDGSSDAPTAADALGAPSATTRLLSSSVDMVVALILVPVLDLVLVFAVLHPNGHTLSASEKNTAFLLYIAALIGSALFFVLLDRTGASPGKRLFKLRTTTVEGTFPAPVTPLLLKYVLIFLLLLFNLYGAIVVIIGLLAPLWRADRRTMFDVLARLRIVLLDSLPPHV
ncbi:MAG: RDD family protein [Actinomycetes bacterium]